MAAGGLAHRPRRFQSAEIGFEAGHVDAGEKFRGGSERDDLAMIDKGRDIGRLQGIEEAFVLAIPPPAVPGIGTGGGFNMQLQNRATDDVGYLLASA
jgi:hypothetical protein